jgi:hypothetical protein
MSSAWEAVSGQQRSSRSQRVGPVLHRGLRPAPTRARPWWAIAPKTFEIAGRETEIYLIAALGAALGVSPWTIRRWERRGLVPRAPLTFEYPTSIHNRRIYTETMLQIVAEAGERHDVAPGRPPSAVFAQEVADAWRHEVDALGLRSTVLRLRPATD